MVKGVTSVTWVRGKVLRVPLSGNLGERPLKNPAPEGRPSLAQRFSAGKSRKDDSSPGGTTEFEAHYKLRCFAARAARRIDEMVVLLQFFSCTFSCCGVSLNVSTVLPNRRGVLKNKAPLILLLLLFLVFALWAQKDQPPAKTPTPEAKIPPEDAAKANP